MTASRNHHDVDLLYPAATFALVDQFLRLDIVQEIVAKRLPHKRAFTFDGVMTEIIIVQSDLTTTFWNQTRYVWPADTFDDRDSEIRLASSAVVMEYRSAHHLLHER